MVLEVGDQAWMLDAGMGDGVTWVTSSAPQPVRLMWADNCAEIVNFTAEPNARYLIRFSADGTANATRTDMTHMGPGLGEARSSPC